MKFQVWSRLEFLKYAFLLKLVSSLSQPHELPSTQILPSNCSMQSNEGVCGLFRKLSFYVNKLVDVGGNHEGTNG